MTSAFVTRSFAAMSGNPVGENAEKIKGFLDGLPYSFGLGDDVMKTRTGENKNAYAVALAAGGSIFRPIQS